MEQNPNNTVGQKPLDKQTAAKAPKAQSNKPDNAQVDGKPAASGIPAPDEKGNVLVNAAALNEILEKVKMLEAVADKSRIQWYENKNPQKILSVVKVAQFNYQGKLKIITGWETVIDEMFQDSNGAWHEKQVIKVHFEDGTAAEMNYIDFVRLSKKVDAEVIGREKDEQTDSETLKVALVDGGRQLYIDIRFVN